MSDNAFMNAVGANAVPANEQAAPQQAAPEGSESSEDLESEELQAKPEESKAEAKKRINKLKIKFNGKEMEETLPFDIDDDPKQIEYMQRMLQMNKLASHKSQEYSQLEREVMDFVEDLRQNPRKALSNPRIGIDIKKLAAEVLEEELENAKKTPEQLKIEEYERRMKELESEREERSKFEEQQRLEMMEQRAYEHYNSTLERTFKEHELPQNPYYVKKVASIMRTLVDNDIDPDASIIAKHVKEEGLTDLKQILGSTPEEQLEALFGDTYEKMRKHRLSKAKKSTQAVKPALEKKAVDVGVTKSEKKEAPKPMSYRDFFKI
jgi:hypothetical protein